MKLSLGISFSSFKLRVVTLIHSLPKELKALQEALCKCSVHHIKGTINSVGLSACPVFASTWHPSTCSVRRFKGIMVPGVSTPFCTRVLLALPSQPISSLPGTTVRSVCSSHFLHGLELTSSHIVSHYFHFFIKKANELPNITH